MNKQILAIIGAVLLLLAIVLFMKNRPSSEVYSASVSSEMPKPRPNSPSFTPDPIPPPKSQGGVGKNTAAAGGQ